MLWQGPRARLGGMTLGSKCLRPGWLVLSAALAVVGFAVVGCGDMGRIGAPSAGDGEGEPPPAGPPRAEDSGDDRACGNGIVESGESCDPPSACPASCDDDNPCTIDTLSGSAATCDATCVATAIEVCTNDDGCCPAGCTARGDNDCSASCGNGVVERNETCDPPETCDVSCDDGDACTVDLRTGSAATCNVACSRTNVLTCVDNDGCCPASCSDANDSDCVDASICGGAGPDTTPLDLEEQAFLQLLNAHRAANGLNPLSACTALNRAAQGHSEDMRDEDYFSHDGLDGSNPVSRACEACYASCRSTGWGENIAAGNADAQGTFNQWRNSPGHNANMLGSSFAVVGIGRATGGGEYGSYWTTVFGGRSDSSCD